MPDGTGRGSGSAAIKAGDEHAVEWKADVAAPADGGVGGGGGGGGSADGKKRRAPSQAVTLETSMSLKSFEFAIEEEAAWIEMQVWHQTKPLPMPASTAAEGDDSAASDTELHTEDTLIGTAGGPVAGGCCRSGAFSCGVCDAGRWSHAFATVRSRKTTGSKRRPTSHRLSRASHP